MAKRSSLRLVHPVEAPKSEPREESETPISPFPVSILSLPTEILTVIVQNVGTRNNLKLVRLSCKRLSSIAAECLFEEVVVVPHEDSFEQLLKLSDHATLSQHVKCLVYDTCTMLEPDDVWLEINANPVLRLYWEVPSRRLRLRSFLKYHDEHTFRTVEQVGQEMQYLIRVFESLPSLKAVKIRSPKWYGIEITGLSRFYE